MGFASAFLPLLALLVSVSASPVLADDVVVIIESTYTMREDETLTVAEFNAFREARQKAVDQTRGRVQEFAKARNIKLSDDQIRTVADAALEIEELEKRRTVLHDRFQFYVKIRATQREEKVVAEIKTIERRQRAEELYEKGLAAYFAPLIKREMPGAMKLREYDKAVDYFTQALVFDPTHDRAYFERGKVLEILQQNERAIADYTRAIQLNPLKGEYYYYRSQLYLELDKRDAALNDLSEAIRVEPIAMYFYKRGELYSENGDYKQAISDFTHGLRDDFPEPTTESQRELILIGRASAYGEIGQHQLAIADYTELIRISGGRAGYAQRGAVYVQLLDFERAVKDLSEALSRESNDEELMMPMLCLRGMAYKALAQKKRALADFSRIIDLAAHSPDSAYHACPRVYVMRGKLYLAFNQRDEALADFTEAIRLDQRVAEAYLGRGLILLQLRLYQRSLSDLTDAIRLKQKLDKKQVALAYRLRAAGYASLDHTDLAVSDFTKAIELTPDDDEAYLGRAIAYAGLGNNALATRDLEKACALGSTKSCSLLSEIR